MKIIIDCFGCDYPEKWTNGIAEAIRQNPEVTIIAVGDEEKILSYLTEETFDRSRLEIVDAKDVIINNESPADAIRHKRDASLVRAYKLLRDRDDIDAMISAGSTGAVLVGGIVILGTNDDIERPGLTKLMPCENGKMACLVDVGANVDSKPENLVQFARYAARYIKSLYGTEDPTVALLSVGTEDAKGNALTKETFSLMRESGLNFVGNMEANTTLSGKYDVIVTDGFAGNVLVKTIEGVAPFIISIIANAIKKNAPAGTDLLYVKSAFGAFTKILSESSLSGAILLGLKKIVIKAHGNSDERSTPAAVAHAVKLIRGGYAKA